MNRMHWQSKIFVGLAVMALPLAGQISRTLLDGATPPAIQPGTADGSWALSKIESINLFSGSASLTIPFLSAGGRGDVLFQMLLPQQRHWIVRATQSAPNAPSVLYPTLVGSRVADMGYGMPVMERRNDSEQLWCSGGNSAISYVANSITRLHWIEGDGSDVELVDAGTSGVAQPAQQCIGGSVIPYTAFNRGKVFASKDGSSMTLVTAADVIDQSNSSSYNIDGTLYKKDGTRYRMEGGKLRWISDRHGNLVTFVYSVAGRADDPWGRPLEVHDPLGRTVSIDYGLTGNHPGEDRITYTGFSSATASTPHTVYVRYKALSDTLLATGETIKKVKALFPGAAYVDQPNINDYDNNPTLPWELELPDGSKFAFKYNSYAELAETTLPTGGVVKYTWRGYAADTADNDGLYGDFLIYRRLKTRKVYENDGSTVLSWSEYSCPTLQQQTGNLAVAVTENDAAGTALRQTEHTFSGNALSAAIFPPLGFPGWREGREFNTAAKIPNSSTLRTVTHTWQQRGPANTSITPSTEQAIPNDPRITQTSTTVGTVTATRTFGYSVDEHNNVNQECERDFGATSATRCVDRTFKTEAAYTAAPVHLRGLVAAETITRYAPAPQAAESSVAYEYDGGSAASYFSIVQFDPARVGGYTTRGNVTKETRSWPEGTGPAITEVTYDIAGNPLTVKTPVVEVEAGATVPTTTIGYTDNYGDATGKNTYAFPTTITNALGQQQSRMYHWGAGRIVTATDPNGQTTTYSYADGLDRPTSADLPLGRSEFVYDRVNRTIQTKNRLTAAPAWLTQTLTYDGLGRTVRTTDAAGVVHDRQYDALGRIWKVWNPGQVSPSAEKTETAYDVLDRPVTVTYADSSVDRTCYTSNETVRVDARLKWTKTVQDGLGRLTSVVEDPSATCQGQTRSGGLGLETTYTYNARDLLTQVNQGGQTRTFDYDGLGRLTAARNPESGVTSYAYDAAGNVKTRSMSGRTLGMKYDLLGRILRKTYTDATNTPEVVHCYDGDTLRSGCAAAPTGLGKNLTGRLTMTSNAAAAVKYGRYDALGRVTSHEVAMGGSSYPFQYAYNELALTKEVYPGGREVSYGFDGAGRVNAVMETSNDVFVSNYASGITYHASGAMTRLVLGNAKVQDQCYNTRLQMTGLRVGDLGDVLCQSGSGVQLKLGLSYGTGNNGNVASQSIGIGTATLGIQNYTYDALNRLKTANETRATGFTAWSHTYVYDRHGNRAMLGSSVPAPATGIPQVTADDSAQVTALLKTQTDPVSALTVVTNQWQSSSVDGAGNVTASATGSYPNTLSYDGENRLVSAVTGPTGTMTAAYDGDGRRVKKTVNGVTTWYVYDAQGSLVQEYGGVAGVAGRQYFVADHLGSTRLRMRGTEVVRTDYYPFGAEIEAGTGDRTAALGYQTAAEAGADGQRVKFTGKERDAETGLDNFLARYYSAAQGRFTSPDEWTGGIVDPFTGQQVGQPGPLPYADITDPQTLNKYVYVRNSPLRYVDPDGHCGPWCAVAGAFGGAVAQAVADVATGQRITLRKEIAAAVGGAIVGGTGGLASELGLAVQIAIVGSSGVVGGIAERTINTGDLNKAMENPAELAKDFGTNAVGHGINKAAEAVVTKVAGGAVEALSSQTARSQSASRQAKVGDRLENAKTVLENKQRAASTVTDTTRDTMVRQQQQKKPCAEPGGCHN